MTNPFGTDDMAAGYANARPPVHPLIMDQVRQDWRGPLPVARALDIGCGAGLSTKALDGFAAECIGLEPFEPMLKWSGIVAPDGQFVVGAAEGIPVRSGSIDVITAAGSLNYVDLDMFFPEASRVLAPGGVLVVYDFLPGTGFRHRAGLDEWFASFTTRYPRPASDARELSPAILANLDCGFTVEISRHFQVGLQLTPEFYLNYMMTETNVAAAVRNGVAREEIRAWCASTLGPVWDSKPHEVLFRGYFVCMRARSSSQ